MTLVPLATGADVAFWISGTFAVIGALGLVLFRKAVYSALSMGFVMLNLAVLYGAMEAPFLVFVQVIVYTGAILMLFLFVLMLVGVDTPDSFVETLKAQRPLAIIAAVATAALLIFAIAGTARNIQSAGLANANSAEGGNVEGIAALLFGRYVFVFELTSGLLITAALAAIMLAHKARVGQKVGQKAAANTRMQAYADEGTHPGALPSSGVFAEHNSIAVPALLPDGTPSPDSISRTLALRGATLDPEVFTTATKGRFAEIEGVKESEDDE